MQYSEKLKDPRWQKKRLEVFERDDFRCSSCLDNTKTLHVHHLLYNNGHQPWEYDLDDLMTLCENCHAYHEHERARLKEVWMEIFSVKLKNPFDRSCSVAVFEKSEDLRNTIYLLWEMITSGNEERVCDFMRSILFENPNPICQDPLKQV